ncbi:MAG: ankyrin repeat domain-containing protein [Gammaproteobacteria bacterium]
MLHGILSSIKLIEDKGPLLYQAIRDGNHSRVNGLLSSYIIPDYRNIRSSAAESESPLILATNHSQPTILIKLLETYKISEEEKGLALSQAAVNGHEAIVNTLLVRCNNVIPSSNKSYALRSAAANGYENIVNTLLNHCNDDIDSNDKGLALLNAAHDGYTGIITSLLNQCNAEINETNKVWALVIATRNGHLDALNVLLGNESIFPLAASNQNALLRTVEVQRNGFEEGTPERARYDQVIARLRQISENSLADIVNFRENSMQSMTRNELALVNHLKKHYNSAFIEKSWDLIQAEILRYLEEEYRKEPAKDGYHRIWMLENGSGKPADFIPADTIGFCPNGHECEVSWKSLDGTLNRKTVSTSDVKSIYGLLTKENYLHQESQDPVLVEAIVNGLEIPIHPHQDKPLPLEYAPNLHESALTSYYRHPVHNAWRYLSNNNPWMSPQASFVDSSEDGLKRAIISSSDKELISYTWLALTDESVTLEQGFTLEGNKSIFAATIAELNRGHNCDERALYANDQDGFENQTENIQTTRTDDLQADRPSCSYGVTKRVLQSQYGHPHFTAPIARPLSLEIIRDRMESLLIWPKSEEAAPDNLIDRLNKLDRKLLNYVQQQISDICYMDDYDESEKITLSDAETTQLNSVMMTPREQLEQFIEGTKLWFSEERIEQKYDNPKLSTGPGANDFFKNHTSYLSFIQNCAQSPLTAFSEILWKAVKAQLERMNPPFILNQYEANNSQVLQYECPKECSNLYESILNKEKPLSP